jgi:hypothetical protein
METTMNHRALDGAKGEIVMYQLDDIVKLDVRLENESVWLNRQQIALLFDRDVKTIGKHINNALREELKDMSTVANFAIVQKSIQAFTPCPTDRLTFGFCSYKANSLQHYFVHGLWAPEYLRPMPTQSKSKPRKLCITLGVY